MSDTSDVSQVFEIYYPKVVSFFLKRGLPPESAKDLAQDVFVNVLRNIGKFRGESSITTWIYTIAKNILYNHVRDSHTQKRDAIEISMTGPQGSDALHIVEKATQENSMIEMEQARRMWAAIDALPKQMRRCMILRVRKGKKYKEIAQLMQLSEGSVKTMIHKGTERLKDVLAGSKDNPSRSSQ